MTDETEFSVPPFENARLMVITHKDKDIEDEDKFILRNGFNVLIECLAFSDFGHLLHANEKELIIQLFFDKKNLKVLTVFLDTLRKGGVRHNTKKMTLKQYDEICNELLSKWTSELQCTPK